MSGTATLLDLINRLESIFTEDDATLSALAKAAGLDPKTDFRNISLNGVPLSDQDVRGFDFRTQTCGERTFRNHGMIGRPDFQVQSSTDLH